MTGNAIGFLKFLMKNVEGTVAVSRRAAYNARIRLRRVKSET
jgi:hypothetical protein